MRSDGSVYDDDTNKMTLFDGRIAFSYTGLAFLEGKRTDLWLRDLLQRPECSSADKGIHLLKTAATEALRGIKIPEELKRIAFVGMGWSLVAAHTHALPLICRVSNFHTEDGSVLPHASDEFRQAVSLLRPNERFALMATGQSLPAGLARKCRWLVRHHVKKGSGPGKLLDILVKVVRECADNSSAVGKSLLSAVIPRQAVFHRTSFILTEDGPPSGGLVSFRTWPDGEDYNAVYRPNFAGQRPVASNFQAGVLGSGSISFGDSSFTITYPCFYLTNEARTVLLTSKAAGMKCLSVYTEREVVEKMHEVGGVKTVCHQIESAEDFTALLRAVEQDFQGVFFNPAIEGKCCSLTIGAMIRSLTCS